MTQSAAIVLDWPELVDAIFVAKGIRDGLWSAGVTFNMVGVVNHLTAKPGDAEKAVPAGVLSVVNVLLEPAIAPGPMIFDAAEFHLRKRSLRKPAKARRRPASF